MAIRSKTFHLLVRLLKALPKKRRNSIIRLIPVAAFVGLADVIVVGLISRLFTVVVGQPNTPSLFNNLR